MSKARLVITAVLIEGRGQSQVARDYGVSQSWISRLIARYTLEGDAAFEPRSRRPQHTSPTRLPQATIDLIITLRTELTCTGLDACPHTITWHLHHYHRLAVSVASISRPGDREQVSRESGELGMRIVSQHRHTLGTTDQHGRFECFTRSTKTS